MLPLSREIGRSTYAGFTIILFEDRADRDFAAVAKRGRYFREADFHAADDRDAILTPFFPSADQAADEARRLIGERIRSEQREE